MTFDIFVTPRQTHHQEVAHIPSAFWYVYDVGKISRIHHNGFRKLSVILATASCLSIPPTDLFSPAGDPSSLAEDEYLLSTIVRGMCHRWKASKSKRMLHSLSTICSIIHRSETLERAYSAVSRALPPPTSDHRQLPTPGHQVL